MLKLNVLIRLIVPFIIVFLPFDSLDSWFFDHCLALRGKQRLRSTPIVLIRVDDLRLRQQYESVDLQRIRHSAVTENKPHSVWYHDFYDKLLTKIQAQNPRLVVFSSYYEWVDAIEFSHLRRSDVIFSALLNEEGQLIPPPPGLTRKGNYGFSNLFPDGDNVVRKSYLVYSSGTSLALRAYYELEKNPVERDLLKPLWIDFRGPTGSYPTYDAHKILDGTINTTFKDKIVIVGRQGGHRSELETPFGKMARLEVHANVIDTFITNREIRHPPRWVTWLIASITVIASVIIILRYPLKLGWVFLIILSCFIFLLSLSSLAFLKVWLPLSNPLICVLTTHLFMLGFKLTRQEEEQWKLQQEAAYLKEMDQFKNNFISLFSHDLKTPIAKIRAVTERLLSDGRQMDNEMKGSLEAIQKTNQDLEHTIGGILKVTKMEAMSLEPSKDVLDLNRLVEDTVKKLRFLAEEKQIDIILDLEPLFSMEGDQELLREVIQNLVENAIKYSPKDKKVIVRTREIESRVFVSVIDEGAGIPAEEIPRVTGKFYRGRMAEKTKGSGLGLYLSKYFVELHNGQLEISSTIGEGTTVSFWLPISS